MLDGKTIAVFRVPLAGLGPEERARSARKRLEGIGREHLRMPVQVAPIPEGATFLVERGLLFAITAGDLDPREARTIEDESRAIAERLEAAMVARSKEWEPKSVAHAIFLALLATALFAGTLFVLRRAKAFAIDRLTQSDQWQSKLRTAVGGELHEELGSIARLLVGIATTAAMLFAGYMWLTYVLNRFPITRPIAYESSVFLNGLARRFATGFVESLPGLATAAIILLLARLAVRIANVLFVRAEHGDASIPWIHPDTASATRRLVVVGIWLFAGITAYPFLPGADSDIFKGVSVFVGVLVTLGSSGMMGQLMSGLVLVYSRALRHGDFVRAGDVEGYVVEVGPLSTKLRTSRDEEFTIPNNVMVGATVKNYSRPTFHGGDPVTVTVVVGYDKPWRVVHALLESAAAKTPGVRKTPPARVLQRNLGTFGVEYDLVVRLEDPTHRIAVTSQLLSYVQDAFNERGVQIMTPAFEGQPESPVVVPPEKWGRSPSPPPTGGRTSTPD
jgi:small-conductance mechanosensitive channel